MLMALIIAIMGQAGAAPTPADLRRMQIEFAERGHHIALDFHGTRGDFSKKLTVGLGYEYLIIRPFHSVSFEVLGQKLGKLFKGPQDWFIGAGLGYYPVTPVKIFMMGGSQWFGDDAIAQGRVGVGYNFPFFVIRVMPFTYFQTTANGIFSWSLGVRLQY